MFCETYTLGKQFISFLKDKREMKNYSSERNSMSSHRYYIQILSFLRYTT